MFVVLHMGGWGLCGAVAGFCWNYEVFWLSVCVVVGLPCAVRVVCAHGSETVANAVIAVPHDSGVSADAEHA